jgi:DNA-binding ferritin-like protein (Dps family)
MKVIEMDNVMERYERIWKELYKWIWVCSVNDENKTLNEILDKMDELEKLFSF